MTQTDSLFMSSPPEEGTESLDNVAATALRRYDGGENSNKWPSMYMLYVASPPDVRSTVRYGI